MYIFKRSGDVWSQHAYLKASNPDESNSFRTLVSMSADGITLASGARREDSKAIGVNGDQNDNSADDSGAVYLF